MEHKLATSSWCVLVNTDANGLGNLDGLDSRLAPWKKGIVTLILHQLERKMKDLLGNKIEVNSVVAYANDAGFLALAVVTEVLDSSLHIVKKGYRGEPIERDLIRPSDVIVIDSSKLDPGYASRPEEVNFIMNYLSGIS